MNSIYELGIIALSTAMGILVLYLSLIIKPFSRYRKQVIRMLMIVSRITEEEANKEIIHLKQAIRLLESESEGISLQFKKKTHKKEFFFALIKII